MKSKRVKYALVGSLGTLSLLLIWGAGIEPRLIAVEEEEATIPNLPREWEGARVALIADLQVGMWLNNSDTIRRVVARLVRERPAAVLIAGDFIYKPLGEETKKEAREELEPDDYGEASGEVGKAVELLRPLTAAGLHTYAVLGNHDYGMHTRESAKQEWMARMMRESLAGADIRVLENEAVPLPPPGRGASGTAGGVDSTLYLVGIGSRFAQNDRPLVALAGVPEESPRLVFMHNPDSFASCPPGAAPLALAAHTHGGQIRLPFTPNWSWMSYLSNSAVHTDGWIENYGRPGNRLYVNRGIGFSYVPIRINCPPEITLFTLRRPG